MEDRCFKCNSEGLIGGCKDCGRELLIGVSSSHKDIVEKDLDRLLIPRFYKTNLWSIVELKENNIDLCDSDEFNRYADQLNKAYQIFCSGSIPNMSAIISAPVGFSKTTWAYSCMIKAFEHGFNVTSLIDTSQLKRLLVTSSEKPTFFHKHDNFYVDQYINCDVLFLTVTKGPEFVYAYEVIAQVLDIRSRLDKPTLIISDFTQRELVPLDKKRVLERLITAKGNINPYKYPASICFNPLDQTI